MSEVPEGTIAEVLDWVDDDPGRAQAALDAERAGQNRSTLISQLESVCPTAPPQEDTVSESTTSAERRDDVDSDVEDNDLAPGPEQPVDVELYPSDAGTHVGPLHVRDADVEVPEDAAVVADPATDLHPESDKTRAQARAFDNDAEPEALEGEQVEYLQGTSGTYALALSINGQTFMFNKQSVGALKQVVDQAVVGLAL